MLPIERAAALQQPAGPGYSWFLRSEAEEKSSLQHEVDSLHYVSPRNADPRCSATTRSARPDEEREGAALARARESYRTGSFSQALSECRLVLSSNPKRTDALLLLGSVYFQLKDYPACIAKHEEAVTLDPSLCEAFCNLADALREAGSVELAVHCYFRALQLRPTDAGAWERAASACMHAGLLLQATHCFRQALLLNPRRVDVHVNLGTCLRAQGLDHFAYVCYREALKIQPRSSIAWSKLAGLLLSCGDYERALIFAEEAVRLDPDSADARFNLGTSLKALGRLQEAVHCYTRALQLCPDVAGAGYGGTLGSGIHEQGHLPAAAAQPPWQAIAADPTLAEAYSNLAGALKDSGRLEEALSCYQACLALHPAHAQALCNCGNIYLERNMPGEAASLYLQAVATTTALSAPYANLASLYKQAGQHAEAIACYGEVLRIDPCAADGLVNRGNIFKELGRVNDAIQDYLAAISVRPSMSEAHANLASAYKDSGYVEAAIQSYRAALLLRPDFPEAFCNLLHTLQCVCEWTDRDKQFQELESVICRQLKMGVLPSVQPFHAIAYPIGPVLALKISRMYAEHCASSAARVALPPLPHPPPVRPPGGLGGRLRVGYVSSDFGNHPLSHLMGSVFGMHKAVEVFCYALSPSDGSKWRQRTEAEAEHFKDVSNLPSDVIARTISADGIQILVNLNGYTKGARNEIFAYRPAPVQVSYMGFPGTTGADFMDYLVSDELVSPPQFAHHYSEKLVYMPNSYFVNDYKQTSWEVLDESKKPRRSEYELPSEDVLLFACFNQLYKMDPAIVTTWCNILKRVPNSALWLLRFPAAGEARIRAYACKEGVASHRIIFTDVAEKEEHIRRSSLADIFLDTPLCNAHTTGTDVLWAGLPMVTLPMEKMATRVAMSLAYAACCGPEMVVGSMAEYEERAVRYALEPGLLQAVATKLRAGRLSCPLFDTGRWVRDLELAFARMWDLHCAGEAPQPFKVERWDV